MKAMQYISSISRCLSIPLTEVTQVLNNVALLMMLQGFGMICLMKYIRPLLFTHSKEAQSLSLCPSISTLISDFSVSLSFVALTPSISQVNDYSFLLSLFDAPRVCL